MMNHYRYKPYNEIRKNEDHIRLMHTADKLPDFAGSYITEYEEKNVLSVATLSAYANELFTFFLYIQKKKEQEKKKKEEHPVDDMKVPADISDGLPSLDKELTDDIKIEDLKSLTSDDIAEFLFDVKFYLTADGKLRSNRNNSLRRKTAALNSFFTYLQGRYPDFPNPAAPLTVQFESGRQSKNPLSDEEAEKLLDGMEKFEDRKMPNNIRTLFMETKERDLAILSLLIYCDLTISDLVALEAKNIDFFNGTLKVVRGNEEEETIKLPGKVLSYMDDYMTNVRCDMHAVSDYDNEAMFLSLKRRRMNFRTYENLVYKYTTAVLGHRVTPMSLKNRHK